MIKKLFRKKSSNKLPTRITNDTVAEHRERVLAGGRKLKYPIQYTRNTLVRNAILISLGALVALVVLVWLQLYIWKDTSDLAYRITRVVPLPVANIDGQSVRYSDYLMYHRSTISVLEGQQGGGSAPSDRMRFQQEQALDRALEDAYAQKLAKERNISISDEQVDKFIEQQRNDADLTEEAYVAVVNDHLRWTIDELRQAMRNTLLRQEVAFSVDDEASTTAQQVADLIEQGSALADIAESLGDKVEYQPEVVVPLDNSDGGISEIASRLEVGQTSGAEKTIARDGYYFITRQSSDEGQVRYSYIKVPLTVFQQRFSEVKDSDKTKLYITINEKRETDV